MEPINLDANATTPIAPEVLDAMQPHWRAGGNPESRHSLGRAARRAWDRAREDVARCLGAHADEVIFTSGGTEANNLAICGSLAKGSLPAHAITSPIEHPAVASPLAQLPPRGVEVTTLTIGHDGVMNIDKYASAIKPETRFATLMLANNETGAIQPVADLAARCADRGIVVHTDAAQAVGRIDVDFHSLGVNLLAASAHKLHGPAGVGILLVKRGTPLNPRMFGGSQQGGLRPGTPPVALAVGMAAALDLWRHNAAQTSARWRALSTRFESQLVSELGRDLVVRHGPGDDARRLPQTLNLGFPGLDANALLMQLDLAGVCVSVGSACASGSTQPAQTLVAMGVHSDTLKSSIRISFNMFTTHEEVDAAAARTAAIVSRAAAATCA